MPSNVIVNGKKQYKPGIYAEVDAAALGGRSTSVGNLAIVGSFPCLEAYKPMRFSNAQTLAAYDPTDPVLQRLAQICFSPSSDDAVGGVDSLTLSSAQTTTQAFIEFVDGDNNKSFILKSKLWGYKGNSIYVKLTSKVVSAINYLDIMLQGMGSTETYLKVGSGDALSLRCTCDEVVFANGDTSTVSIDNDSLDWSWLKKLQTASGEVDTYTGNNLVIDKGLITFKTLSASSFGTNTLLLTVTGLSDTGAAVTGYAKHGDGAAGFLANATVTTQASATGTGGADVKFSRIDTVTWAKTDGAGGAYGGLAPAISGKAFALVLSPSNQFTTALDVVNYINNYTTKGWSATAIIPQCGAIPAAQIDKQTSVDTLSAAAKFKADLWAVEQALSGSGLVTFTRSTTAPTLDGQKMPVPWGLADTTAGAANLLGGTETAISSVATAYAAALVPLEIEDIQFVASMSTDVLAAQALVQHCKNAALAESERQAFFGCPANTTIANILGTYTGAVNSRHLAILAQQIQRVHPLTGAREWLDPNYTAILAASMHCGVSIGMPITFKRPNILDVRQDSSWLLVSSDNEVISKGIYAITKDRLGFKVLRSITCYLTDDNPAFSEVSAVTSFNYSIRDLRDQLSFMIGGPAIFTPNQLKGIVTAILSKQVDNKFVYANPPEEIVIAKVADKYSIDYGCVPVFPFNFGSVKAHVKG